jgi:hypothetical protein
MQQIYPEDRGQNYSIRMGDQVAKMAMQDIAASSASRTEQAQPAEPA